MYRNSRRIWELDALRGFCIAGMVIVHLLYDLMNTYAISAIEENTLFRFLLQWGGTVFFLLSGICATLGQHPVRRGLCVLAGGFICSAATWLLYTLGLAAKSLIIYFGVLHCLGVCMLLWPMFKKLPGNLLFFPSAVLIGAGLWLDRRNPGGSFLTLPLGLPPAGFASSDYFPLLPNLGFFLLGSAFGRCFYRNKATRFPHVNLQNPLIRFFTFCGRRALPIYLLHQPVIAAFLWLFAIF